LVSVFFE
jgi:hypothetical protein